MVLVLCVRVYCGGWAAQGLRPLVSCPDILGPRVIEPGSIKFDHAHTCVHTLCVRDCSTPGRSTVVQRPQCLLLCMQFCYSTQCLLLPEQRCVAQCIYAVAAVLVRTIYAYICDLFMSWLAAVPCATQQHPVAVPPVAVPLIRRSHTVRLW